jgi:hypothetical protein
VITAGKGLDDANPQQLSKWDGSGGSSISRRRDLDLLSPLARPVWLLARGGSLKIRPTSRETTTGNATTAYDAEKRQV